MPHDPFYNSKPWREARAKQLAKYPYCCICSLLNMKTKATEVDHEVAIERGGAPFAPSNLRSKCKTHHSQKTILFDRPSKPSQRVAIVSTGVDGWPVHVEVNHAIRQKVHQQIPKVQSQSFKRGSKRK